METQKEKDSMWSGSKDNWKAGLGVSHQVYSKLIRFQSVLMHKTSQNSDNNTVLRKCKYKDSSLEELYNVMFHFHLILSFNHSTMTVILFFCPGQVFIVFIILRTLVCPYSERSSWIAWRRILCSRGSCWHEMGCRWCLRQAKRKTNSSQYRHYHHLFYGGIPTKLKQSECTYNHINCQSKFLLYNLNESVFLNLAFFVWLSPKCHKGIQVFITVILRIIDQLNMFQLG